MASAGPDRMPDVTRALGGRLAFGADYNPEQWPLETWLDDVSLMRDAGVNLVSLGIFSWALLEPAEGSYEFGWLDRVVDLLEQSGISIDLATATASPPPWFKQAYPHAMLTDERGLRRSIGSRQAYCPSSPEYRAAAVALTKQIAARYGERAGVVMWHVNNEFGCHNWHCYCATSEAAFRSWLTSTYGSLDALNDAWGTAFWSQRYSTWDQIDPPRAVSYNSFANPGQQLDWWRFSSDALLDCFRAEAAAIRAVSSQPVTTNFMGFFKPVDYWSWAGDQDIVSNDHYLLGDDPQRAQQLAMTADLLRSLAGQRPWLLMEHSTSAVNWQPRNLAKGPGEMRRNSMQHIARGADGAMFFQWRASRAGAEKFHSALVPHAGTDSRIWREVVSLGADLRAIAEVVGSQTEPAQVAVLFDWPSWWAAGLDSHPSVDVDPLATARRWHAACWATNVGVDFAGAHTDLATYRVVVVPTQYLMNDQVAEKLQAYVHGGGTLVATYFSGIVDVHDQIRLGGYPGALRAVLGISIEEFYPLAAGGEIELTAVGRGSVWSELGRSTGAEVVAAYATGPCAGSPAITRHQHGIGDAWYVGTELDDQGQAAIFAMIIESAGVESTASGLAPGVEAVARRGGGSRYVFIINHTDSPVLAPVSGVDLLSGDDGETISVDAGGVAVIREGSSLGAPQGEAGDELALQGEVHDQGREGNDQ